jgi:hypothetical protein
MKLNVLMPVFNGDDVLEETVANVLDQSAGRFTFVIVDDGSLDGTNALLRRLAAADPRIRLVSPGRNSGIVAALNLGLQRLDADCEYVARIDCGDLCDPTRLEKQVRFMEAHPGCAVVGCRFEVFSTEGQLPDGIRRFERFSNALCSPDEIALNFTVMSPLHHPTWLCRRRVFDELGVYDERYEAAEDYELIGRVLTAGLPVFKVPEVLVRCRFTPGRGISQTRRVQQVKTGLGVKLRYVRGNHLKDSVVHRCLIWGSGEFAGYLVDLLGDPEYHLSPRCVTDFDEQRWGQTVRHLSVLPPDDAFTSHEQGDVIITMWNQERERILAFLDARDLVRNQDYFVFS